jgi:hypothetical protein
LYDEIQVSRVRHASILPGLDSRTSPDRHVPDAPGLGHTDSLRLLALAAGTRGDTVAPTGLLLGIAAFMFVAAGVSWRWPGLWPPRMRDPLHRLSDEAKAPPPRWLPALVLIVFGLAMLLLALASG